MTKKTRFAVGAVVVAVTAGGLWIYRNAEATETPAYRFATVTRGNLESTVSATGALSAVTTVQVGTQVSGLLSQIYVDFNDRVKKGQFSLGSIRRCSSRLCSTHRPGSFALRPISSDRRRNTSATRRCSTRRS